MKKMVRKMKHHVLWELLGGLNSHLVTDAGVGNRQQRLQREKSLPGQKVHQSDSVAGSSFVRGNYGPGLDRLGWHIGQVDFLICRQSTYYCDHQNPRKVQVQYHRSPVHHLPHSASESRETGEGVTRAPQEVEVALTSSISHSATG